MKKSVYIAVPNDCTIVTELSMNLIQWSHDPKYKIKISAPSGLFPLDNARNTIVKDFLETDYEYLWWIDRDIVPPINALDRLIQADKDAIGAVCFSMKKDDGDYFPYPVTLRFNDEQRYEVYYGEEIEEVDAVGGACVLVKREIYETIERPYEFLYHKDGTLALTCDFYIWKKVKEAGFKLWVDFGITCDHIRTCSIKGVNDLMANLTTK